MMRIKSKGLAVLTGVLLVSALTACRFEARASSGDDAEQKKADKAQKADKGADKDDAKKAALKEKKDAAKAKKDKKDAAKDKKKDQAEPAAQPAAAEIKGDAILLPGNIVFEPGKAELKAGSGSEEVLGKLKEFLDQQTRVTLLRIEGYSDNSATAAENLKISGERALTIKKWLVGKGIAESRLLATGFGDKKPIADNSTEEGRAQNRRSEFKIAKVNGKNYLGNDPLGGGTEFK